MRVLIAGCGYLGTALGAELVRQGHQVVGLRRTADTTARTDLAAAGIEPFASDLADPAGPLPEGRFDRIVFAAGPGPGADPAASRAVFVAGTRRLVERYAAEPPARYVHLGSITVYGQTDGSIVKEHSSTEPADEAGRVQVETERVLLDGAARKFPAVLLRLARVYGPGRELFLQPFIRNEVRLAGQGHRVLNLIHRDDAVSAVVAALGNGRPGEIYNVVDQEPVTEITFYTWLAETLGKYVPPLAGAGSDPAEAPNRRVSSRRLTMELGCRLKYPNFRLGYTAEVKRLTDAGGLDIPREERG